MPKWPTTTKWPPSGAIPPTDPLSIFTSVTRFAMYRGDNVTISTGVSSWNDMTGNARHLTQATGAAQPVSRSTSAAFNYAPTVLFDGVDDELTGAFSTPQPGTQPRCYVFVMRQVAWSSTKRVFGGLGAASLVFMNSASPQLAQYNGGVANGNTGAAEGVAKRGVAYFSNSTADTLTLGSVTQTGVSATNTNSSASWTIGSATGSLWSNVEFAEMIILNGLPSAAELAAYDAYCSARYGAGVLT